MLDASRAHSAIERIRARDIRKFPAFRQSRAFCLASLTNQLLSRGASRELDGLDRAKDRAWRIAALEHPLDHFCYRRVSHRNHQ